MEEKLPFEGVDIDVGESAPQTCLPLHSTRETPASAIYITGSWSREDHIRLCYLAILTGGLLSLDRREAIPFAQAKLLMDLKIFEQYPWGKAAFVELVTCMCPQSIAKIHPVWEHQDEDPEIDNLLVFLRQDNSLSTITWQALSEYPLTPIECNKRRLVASQRKSKKSKKVASNGQDNIADGDNLASRITQLEEVMHGKTPAHDQFSNTKLPATPATTLKGIDGDKEESKSVREGHLDNLKEENAGENMEEELPFEREGTNFEESAPETIREEHPDNPEEENAEEDMEKKLPFEGKGLYVGKSAHKQ
ncbi:hypothetical protein F2Q69_00022455 [Brassica cretica]|uniref:DUF1985 domain-containing protein n=1 Tax=Brassica cretica TaxID=69181 RepID=A0A8S9QHK1_BRACR|nr:hypothetical protein F2Q69_00022455 [Brassica cretica]